MGSDGSTAMHRIDFDFSCSLRAVPIIVPLVPSPATKCVSSDPSASQNLDARSVVVSERVRRVRVLIGIEIRARILVDDLARELHRAIGAFEWIGENDLRPERARDVLARLRHVRRHDELDAQAERRAKERVCDAGVPARRVDEDLVLREAPIRERVSNHAQRGTILHAAAGVLALELAEYTYFARVRNDAAEAHERRVPHRVRDGLDAS